MSAIAIYLLFGQTFDSAVRVLTLRDYDYLDFRNESFDKDYVEFLSRMDSVTEKLQHKLENTYNGVWDTPHAFQYLPRFEIAIYVLSLFATTQLVTDLRSSLKISQSVDWPRSTCE